MAFSPTDGPQTAALGVAPQVAQDATAVDRAPDDGQGAPAPERPKRTARPTGKVKKSIKPVRLTKAVWLGRAPKKKKPSGRKRFVAYREPGKTNP
jgi:hypothetical protein